jgi:ribose transport system ATP-binding protein
MNDYAIVVNNVKKSFGGVHALKNIDLKVKKGSIHAVIGENGAGKSTLMKILSGIYLKDSGQIIIDGEEVNFTTPKESQAKGIGIIHQELALSPDLTVAENIFLSDLGFGTSIVDWKQLNQQAHQALNMLGFHIDPTARTGNLTVAYQQMVEIAKALAQNISVLILDEPTAVLSSKEIDILFTQLKRLQAKGVTIVYISHRLEELFRLSDTITVIKDGETVTELVTKDCTEDDIILSMVGRQFKSLYPPKITPQDEVAFEVKGLSTVDLLKDINLTVKRGEIIGLAGLVGSGRSELARCLFGIDKFNAGEVIKDGQVLKINSPVDTMNYGIGLVPENRKEQGAILSRPIHENMTLSNLKSACYKRFGIFDNKKEQALALALQKRMSIKLGSLNDPISSLSGGNQQKVVIAKWLNTDCNLLILDEPTRGVDVGAKVEIYHIINFLAKNGYSVIVISSELVEVIGLANRVYVMSEGEITGELSDETLTETNIMRLALPKRAVA